MSNVPVNIAALAFPTLTVMCGDGDTTGSNSNAAYRLSGAAAGNNPLSPNTTSTAGLVNSSAIVPRHLEGVNFLFTDGHVKWIKTNDNVGGIKGFVYRSPTPLSVSQNTPTFRVRE